MVYKILQESIPTESKSSLEYHKFLLASVLQKLIIDIETLLVSEIIIETAQNINKEKEIIQ